jgi:hypothetical protein
MERSNEERETELNPHRADDRERATELQAARLRGRQVPLTGRETSDDIVEMTTAVERFEAAVMALGGDSMTNAPDSHDPDDEALVLPRRRDGEDARDYAERVTAAADRLGRSAD